MDEEFEKKLRRDIYDGNGKEPLMVRMRLTEERVDGLKETMENMDRKLNKVGLLILGVLLTVIGEAVARGIWH